MSEVPITKADKTEMKVMHVIGLGYFILVGLSVIGYIAFLAPGHASLK